MIYTLLPILALGALGFLLARLRWWPQDFFKHIGQLVAKITLPIYFFVRISQRDIKDLKASMIFPLAALIILGLSLALGLILFSLLRYKGSEKRTALALACFGNSGYVPLALIQFLPLTLAAAISETAVGTMTLFVGSYVMAFSPLLWSLGNYLASGSLDTPRLKNFLTPPFIGILCGFTVILMYLIPPLAGLPALLTDKSLPVAYVFEALKSISSLTVPLIMIALGAFIANLKFNLGNLKKFLALTWPVISFRFLLLPGIFWLFYFLLAPHLALTPLQLFVLFLETHTPSATNLSIMAINAQNNVDQVSFGLLLNYVVYIFFLPFSLLLFISIGPVLH